MGPFGFVIIGKGIEDDISLSPGQDFLNFTGGLDGYIFIAQIHQLGNAGKNIGQDALGLAILKIRIGCPVGIDQYL